jgi:hypothetical protein
MLMNIWQKKKKKNLIKKSNSEMLKIFFVLVCVERDVEQRAQGIIFMSNCCLFVRYRCFIGVLLVISWCFIGALSVRYRCFFMRLLEVHVNWYVKKINIYQSL